MSRCAASTVAAIESTGVIPEPAATSTWCSPGATSGLKRPCGGPTSSSSPAASRSTSQVENRPSSTRRTPMRGAAPSGAQIEYERRSSPSSVARRSVRYWPARKR